MENIYVIRKISDDLIFLVDRKKTQKFWWSYDLGLALCFSSKEKAQEKADSLKFGTLEVLTLKEAKEKRAEIENKHEKEIATKSLNRTIYRVFKKCDFDYDVI